MLPHCLLKRLQRRTQRNMLKSLQRRASMRQLIKTAEDIREKSFEEEMAPSEILDYAEKESLKSHSRGKAVIMRRLKKYFLKMWL